ncbi:MAG TPA: hypothetical protein VKU88_00645 [Acidimicrobiales bacterium]|nr:hypothetical protein [Acidimicrobiales bacterium]
MGSGGGGAGVPGGGVVVGGPPTGTVGLPFGAVVEGDRLCDPLVAGGLPLDEDPGVVVVVVVVGWEDTGTGGRVGGLPVLADAA